MILDKPIRMAFLVSLGIHSLLFSPMAGFVHTPVEKQNIAIEVTYVDIKDKEQVKIKPIHTPVREVTLKEEKKSTPKKAKEPLPDRLEQAKKATKKNIAREVSPKKPIKEIDLNRISYHDGTEEAANYLRAVREKIRSFIHENYKISMGQGKALLYFVLNSNGSLESTSIMEDALKGNVKLKNLCIDSVQFSSPFKPFPKGLDFPQAAFNISISFKEE